MFTIFLLSKKIEEKKLSTVLSKDGHKTSLQDKYYKNISIYFFNYDKMLDLKSNAVEM